MSTGQERILFYDGDCGFCNRSVQFVLKNDKTKSIKFAAIQSEFTQKKFSELGFSQPDLSTFYFLSEGVLYEKSTAGLKVSQFFRFPQNLFQVFWIVPKFMRDAIYNKIAQRRTRLMRGFCVRLEKEELSRFYN